MKESDYTVSSFHEALKMAKNKDVYIYEGSRLYMDAILIVDKMYVTKIDKVIKGNTYLPKFNEEAFYKEIDEKFTGDIPYTYMTYTRVR